MCACACPFAKQFRPGSPTCYGLVTDGECVPRYQTVDGTKPAKTIVRAIQWQLFLEKQRSHSHKLKSSMRCVGGKKREKWQHGAPLLRE
mmetsp:Transcript_139660/g.254075  ORF Transcript_139660/g.254075 Transcript_139660/m.254075 type:complete len:89 (+) Transcript_139660:113-379(+)